MALAFTIDSSFYIPKGPSVRIGRITLDNHYPGDVNGWAISAADLQFQTAIKALLVQGAVDGYMLQFNGATGKLQAFYPTVAAAAHTHTFTGIALSEHAHAINIIGEGTLDATYGISNTPTFVKTAAGDATIASGAGGIQSGGAVVPSGTNANAGAIAAAAGTEVEHTHAGMNNKVVGFIAFGY